MLFSRLFYILILKSCYIYIIAITSKLFSKLVRSRSETSSHKSILLKRLCKRQITLLLNFFAILIFIIPKSQKDVFTYPLSFILSKNFFLILYTYSVKYLL